MCLSRYQHKKRMESNPIDVISIYLCYVSMNDSTINR